MGSAAMTGKTAVLQVATELPPTPPVAWTDLTEITVIGNFIQERAIYNATFHSSDEFSSQITGVKMPETLDFTTNYIPADYVSQLQTPYGDNELRWYRILPPDGETIGQGYWQFEARISKIEVSTPLDGLVTIDGTFAIDQEQQFVVPA